MNDKPTQQLQIHVPQDQMPVFANIAKINVTNEEVSFQFAYVRAEEGRGTLVSEVVLTREHAIRFKNALEDTIQKHFTRHLEK